MKTKEFIITLIFIISLLIMYSFFPVKNIFQQIIAMVVFFVFIPAVFNKVFLKRKLVDIGIRIGDWKQGLIWSGISIVIAGILFFIAIYFFGFFKHYTIPSTIIHDYKGFLFYEFILIIPIIFIYDFFFRGFVMLTSRGRLYYWAIVVQALVFLVLVFITKSFTWGLTPYLISAPLAGISVYKSNSIFYSVASQFFIIVILDVSMVRLIR